MMSSSVKSAARTLDVLEFIARSAEPPTFLEISTILDIPKSSLFHLLNTLVDRQYISQVGRGGGYALGPSVPALARAERSAPSAAAIAAPLLMEISGPLNETSGYYEIRDFEAEILAAECGRQALLYSLVVGDRAPLHAVSAGKALLAASSPVFIDEFFKRSELIAYTPRTITDEGSLRAELERSRQTGFSYSVEEHTPGIVGVAMSVTGARGNPGAVNVALPAVRFTPDARAVIERQLKAVRARIQLSLTQSARTPLN